ncbi:nitronate monooxygenase [Shewanella algae]|uniref:NAD(P)H-dependent flavin oxidoreductase n=1 Tax=Shewanella algae TaxID=38313 RepID=UPI00313EFB8F
MLIEQLFGIELPLIQAPMAGAQGVPLALAVASAGALGSIPCAMLSHDKLKLALESFRRQSDRPVNLNFFCHKPPEEQVERLHAWLQQLAPYYREFEVEDLGGGAERRPFDAEVAAVIEPFRPEVVSFHFGLPSTELMLRVKSWGTKVIASATCVAEAKWLESRGVDAIIAQGLEAGGHRGHFLSDDLTEHSGTFALLPRLVQAVKVPVIAAGGIADAAGVQAAMALGAAGVQVGTAYLLCPEAEISELHRQALKDPQMNRHTALTNLYSGRPARGIMTRLMRELGPLGQAPDFPLAANAIAPLRAAAEARDCSDFSPLWCGQNPDGCREIPAADLTRELMAAFIRA